MFTITDHAVERFVERISPGATMASARARIEAYADSAARLKQRTNSGESLYASDELNCRLVVRPSQVGERGGVVVTIVPKDDACQDADGVIVDIPDDAEFDPVITTNHLIAASVLERQKILVPLSRPNLLAIKAETFIRMQMATERKQGAVITMLNTLGASVNLELKKRPLPPIETKIPNNNDALLVDLRRALADMLFKYGWHGNEAVHEIYQRAKTAKTESQ